MSSGPGQSSAPSKAVNISSQPSTSLQVASNPGIDTASQRRVSAGLGAGSSSKSLSSPRNHQSRRNQHKRHRRPRLDDEDVVAESAAMKSTMSRKGQTSITHLMNFSLPPRPQQNPNAYPRGPRRNNTWGPRSGYHAVDKARYVHANYRFIVNPKNNYYAQATNADIHLDWNSVLQVLVSTDTQGTSCPICLSTPIAPRMAKCGHVFCLPCLIRFMHSTDDSNPLPEKKARWKKCPICWDIVYISDTRPVGWYTRQTDPLVEGGDVVLRLVMRRPGSTLALPRDGVEAPSQDDDIPWYHVAEVPDYARIMKGGKDYMTSQYDSEIEDLLRQEREDELLFGDDTTWTRKAVAAIKDAKERVRDIGNPPTMHRQPLERRPTRVPIKFEEPPEGVPEMYKIEHATKSGQSLPSHVHTPSNPQLTLRNDSSNHDQMDDVSSALSKLEVNNHSEMQNWRSESNLDAVPRRVGKPRDTDGAVHPSDHPFFFYQALPHFYLSPLDIRILKTAFGDYSQFPSTILPRIERISSGHIVDEDLRKRTKYLGHLPYGCEVSFLECDWRDIVGPDVLDKFRDDIERRRKRNREKAAREEKERIRAEKNEDEQRWAAARRKRPSITSADRPFSENDFQPLSLEPSSGPGSGFDPNMSSASPPWSSSRGINRPSFTALASPSGSPPDSSSTRNTAHRTVWGTAAIAPTSPRATYRNPDREPNDGWLQDWERELIAEQERQIFATTTNMDRNGPSSSTNAAGTTTGGGKKKKNKKITLMSTTARRAA
ncbi:RING finger domain-containing protein, variant [Blastomyces dermatitidis ER-3]|nr:RING finger domain-containing protein [Blastomyces dermatitidis ER-3]XP_045281401.1 RING finger domain-containing protein, variant [Blastomyces dermatitidis ER-3]EGE81413.2 RING finger domain-containing protein [Blastomyces dermatitidis ATCC 18188]EQL29165.1 hypothetical protein BDFG_08160 [Blastomyces dermatitidis ATCC 26199]EQL29166.1 hypothetical protein, variant [Blastomyces dermatitidis ATCC 26199]OAT01673.1 RING finger domain-containing protein [Blastomyces dermatitidis ER-3]OAT01674